MLSSYNTRSHITEQDFDDATMIEYITNTCDSSEHPYSIITSTQPPTGNSILNNSFSPGVGKIFTDIFSSSSNTFLGGLIGTNQQLQHHHHHQQQQQQQNHHHQHHNNNQTQLSQATSTANTSPVSSIGGESSQSNSPITNGTVYDADDSGLDTTNMSCATTDGYFGTNNNHLNHHQQQPQQPRHPQIMQETPPPPNQIHSNSTHINQENQRHQLHQEHPQQITSPQFAPQFNCMRPFNRSISHQSDCSNLTSSDTSTLTQFSTISGDTIASGHNGSLRDRGEYRQTTAGATAAGNQIRSVAEQAITDETSTLFEFPINFHHQNGVAASVGTGSEVELKIITEPARHHRARYRTEGSRGAIKDRSGRSFPVVKLTGYNCSPVKLRCYIGHDRRQGQPHLYYQVSRIIGKNITPCTVIKANGVKMIEIDLLPENDMSAIINCIGIVKERNFDVQRRCIVSTPNGGTAVAKGNNCLKRKQPSTSHSSGDSSQVCRSSYSSSPTVSKCTATNVDTNNCDTKPCFGSNNCQSTNSMANSPASRYQLEKRSTTCTLVFTCTITNANGTTSNLMAVSDVINCAQILGSPEIHKVSLQRDRIIGGSEVFVIGKNFTRDSKIVWDIFPPVLKNHFTGIDVKYWLRDSEPESDFVNQNHLVFKVPPLKSLINDSPDLQGQQGLLGQPSGDQIAYVAQHLLNSPQVQVQFRIKCGEKISEPCVFTFISSTDLPSDCDGIYRSSSF